ncbi:MAG TPA: response regulator [Trueperaceae bacterium]|nr:response regulator [Trueperaceae bacterium]
MKTRPRFPSGPLGGGAAAPSVLIADPDVATRSVLRIVLERTGYRTRAAVTAAEALALLNDRPDALVTELVFPDRRGLELVQAARQADPATIVIVLSEISNDLAVIEALRAGAHDYVRKPFSPDELVARLERHGSRD